MTAGAALRSNADDSLFALLQSQNTRSSARTAEPQEATQMDQQGLLVLKMFLRCHQRLMNPKLWTRGHRALKQCRCNSILSWINKSMVFKHLAVRAAAKESLPVSASGKPRCSLIPLSHGRSAVRCCRGSSEVTMRSVSRNPSLNSPERDFCVLNNSNCLSQFFPLALKKKAV